MREHPGREIALTTRRYAGSSACVPRRCAIGAALIATALAMVTAWPGGSVATAAGAGVSLSASLPSGQPVGTTITFTGHSTGMRNPVYRFSVGSAVVRDFSRTPSFSWTPLHEGAYTVQVTAKDGFAATNASTSWVTFAIASRVQGQGSVVTPTANPLVALYSAPACAAGSMVVQFRPAAGGALQSTAPQPCRTGQSVNVLVAGMRPNTSYLMQHVVINGAHRTTSKLLAFTTGAPPAGLKITTFTVKQSAMAQSDPSTQLIFHALIPTPAITIANPIATDLSGQLVWYYDTLHSGLALVWPLHILPGGTVLLFGRDQYRTDGDDVLREVDLAGDPVRETNIDAVNAQLIKRGQDIIYAFHHDAIRLPNGDTAVIGEIQRRVGKIDVMSDLVIVLDSNLQVVWTWNAFDHMTPLTHYPPDLTCNITYPLTLCNLPDALSEDWTHANGLGWSPEDDDLTVSIRHLDWVLKIDYRNGKGNGNIVWRLGKGGNFIIKSSDPYPWFSHQHNAYLVDPTTMVLFDNGNTRCLRPGVKTCDSRGQELKLDEGDHVATVLANDDLGSFRQALGSAQRLANGNLFFAGGFPVSRESEFTAAGKLVYELDTAGAEYRDYRLAGLSF
jgi:arylsulfate sulfotransferase